MTAEETSRPTSESSSKELNLSSKLIQTWTRPALAQQQVPFQVLFKVPSEVPFVVPLQVPLQVPLHIPLHVPLQVPLTWT